MLPAAQIPGATLGALMGESARAGRDKLTLALPEEIASFGGWVEQLIAESTGKEDVGIVPVVGEPLGAPDVYGHDRVFVAIGEHDGLDALEKRRAPGRPAAVRRPRADRRRVLPLGDGHGDRGLRARHQPVRPAERAGGQGRHQGDPRLRLGRGPGVRRPRRAAQAGDRGRLRGDPRVPGPDLRDRGRDRTRTPRDPRPIQGGHDDRVRPAVPALDRTAPQGRPEQRRVHPGGGRGAFGGPADPGPALHVRDADRRAGARRPARRSGDADGASPASRSTN